MQMILLDTRYFRGPLKAKPREPGRGTRYLPSAASLRSAATKEIGAYTKRRQHMTFKIHASRRADETMFARIIRRADLKYAPAMFFAQAPRITPVAANLPQSGLEAPFHYDALFNGDRSSIPNEEHARKARRSCDVRL